MRSFIPRLPRRITTPKRAWLVDTRWRTEWRVSKGTRRSSAAPRHQYLWHANPQLRIPRHSAGSDSEESLIRKTSSLGETAQEGGKVVFDECGSMSLLAAFPALPFPFSELESYRAKIEGIGRIDKLRDSVKKRYEREKETKKNNTNNVHSEKKFVEKLKCLIRYVQLNIGLRCCL